MSDYSDAATKFLEQADPDEKWGTKQPDLPTLRTIEEDIVDEIVDEVMTLLAEIHAQIICVGSEREAILEDEELRAGVEHAFSGWDKGEGGSLSSPGSASTP